MADDREHDDSTHDHRQQQWWYNHRTGEVEEGRQSLGSDRDGPYASREDAQRAPEIARERARRWAEEESRGD